MKRFVTTLANAALFSFLIVGLSSTAEANLVTNGSFETPDVTPDADPGPPNGFLFQGVPGGGTLVWTVAGQGVFVIDGFDNFNDAGWDGNTQGAGNTTAASDGDQYLQLQNNGLDSTISQTLTTDIGQAYVLKFDYSAIDFSSRNLTLGYSVGGTSGTVNMTSADGQLAWVTETVNFTATATSTMLTFTGDGFSGFYGPSIDNVSVNVPEPTSAAMFGLALACLGFRRRK